MDNRNITEMSFDEIFPEIKISDNKSDMAYRNNEFTEDDGVHRNYDTDCKVRLQKESDIPNNYNMGYNPDNIENNPCSDLNFTESAYQYNNTNIGNESTVLPKIDNYSSYGNRKFNNQNSVPDTIPFFNDTVNYSAKNQITGNRCVIMGTMALIFSFFGLGILFSIITLIMVSHIKRSEASKNTKLYRQKKQATAFAVFAIIISFFFTANFFFL